MNRLSAWTEVGRPRGFRPIFLALFAGFVLAQVVLLFLVGSAGEPSMFRILVGVAVATPVVALVIFLFPQQVFLLVPLLILIPVRFSAFYAFEWFFLAALLAYALRESSSRPVKLRLRFIDVVFLLYILWGFLAVTQAANVRMALVGMKPPIIFFLAFWTGSRIITSRSFPALLRIYALVALGVAIEILFVLIVEGYSFSLLITRASALTDVGWGRSNYISAVSVLAACAVLPLAFLRNGRGRALAIAGLGAAVFVTIASMSRGGTVALLLGLLIVITMTARRNLGLGFLIMVGISAAYVLSPVGQAAIDRFIRPEQVASMGARFLFFREATQIALSHPILGVGPDQIPYHTYFYMDSNPHNIFLKNAADFGFVGLALYVTLLGWVVFRWFSLHRRAVEVTEKTRATALLLVISVAVFNASYEPTLSGPRYGLLFWLLVGSLTAPPWDEHEDRSG